MIYTDSIKFSINGDEGEITYKNSGGICYDVEWFGAERCDEQDKEILIFAMIDGALEGERTYGYDDEEMIDWNLTGQTIKVISRTDSEI